MDSPLIRLNIVNKSQGTINPLNMKSRKDKLLFLKQSSCIVGLVLWEELIGKLYYSLMFFIAYAFKGQVRVFVG